MSRGAGITALVAAVVIAGGAALVLHTGGSASTTGLVGACPTSQVKLTVIPAEARRDGVPDDIPWVSSSDERIAGALFYYGSKPPFDTTQATIGVGGQAGGGMQTKVLWWIQNAETGTLTMTGRRLDRPGFFRQVVPGPSDASTAINTTYPSIVSVPVAGCWRVSVQSGSESGSVVFRAVSAA